MTLAPVFSTSETETIASSEFLESSPLISWRGLVRLLHLILLESGLSFVSSRENPTTGFSFFVIHFEIRLPSSRFQLLFLQ
jgi:hypothetical protein